MGVFMLRSYTEQKDLYRPVQLPLQPQQQQHAGKPRLVVFDAAGALRSFLRPSKRGLLYDFHHQQSRVRSLVKAFRQAGYELVVFLDLCIPSDKLTTWYRRRVVDASTLRKLNQHLTAAATPPAAGAASPGSKPSSLPESLWIPPNSCVQLLGDAFVEAGCRVFYSADDADKEAAFWAKQHRAHAVITDDTDFLCYEGVERIWSANIKLPSSRPTPGRAPTIRVSELQRKQLLSSLGLNQVQLQQLAGLLGNDHIKHIAKDRLAQLREAHPGEHVVSVLAKQVLQLQPALGGGPAPTANGVADFAPAHGPVLPEVAALVAAAVQAAGGGRPAPAEPAAKPQDKAGKAAAEGSSAGAAAAAAADPVVARLVSRAVAKVVTAADAGLDLEDLNEADLDAFLEGEEFEVGPGAAAEDDEADDAAGVAAPGAGGEAAAAAGAADGSPAAAATSAVERCKRAMQQYSFKGVSPPVSAGSGDRWLLVTRATMTKAVGLEDLSRIPAHVLLQPLRLAVYASLGLTQATEYMCVPQEQWRSWATGHVVEVPALKERSRRNKRDKGGRGGDGRVDPAVKKLVAAVFASMLGTPAAGEGGSKAAAAAAAADGDGKEAGAAAAAAASGEEGAAADAAAPAAAAEADAAVSAADAAAAAEAAAAAAAAEEAEAAAAAADGVDLAVRKLVKGALAKAVSAANRAAARAARAPYEGLPKVLPTKPTELAALLVKRLRQLDRSEKQFSKEHEKLLLLQVSHRTSLLGALRSAHAQVQNVRLPDLHAANLFLQAYAMLHIAADGKLPRVTAMLHVEGFHALCQHPELVAKVQAGPSDAEVAKAGGGRGGPSAVAACAAAAAAVAGVGGSRGFRGPKGGGGIGGRIMGGPHAAGPPHMAQQPRGYRGGARGGGGEGYGPPRGGFMGGPPGGPPGRPPAPQVRGEGLTWQQREQRGPSYRAGGPPGPAPPPAAAAAPYHGQYQQRGPSYHAGPPQQQQQNQQQHYHRQEQYAGGYQQQPPQQKQQQDSFFDQPGGRGRQAAPAHGWGAGRGGGGYYADSGYGQQQQQQSYGRAAGYQGPPGGGGRGGGGGGWDHQQQQQQYNGGHGGYAQHNEGRAQGGARGHYGGQQGGPPPAADGRYGMQGGGGRGGGPRQAQQPHFPGGGGGGAPAASGGDASAGLTWQQQLMQGGPPRRERSGGWE